MMSDGPENLASSFQAVSDACLDGIVTIDVTGSVMAINPAGERLFGACKADLLGRNVSCLMPNPHSERHDSYLQNYARTGSKNVIGRGREVQARRLDTGELFWIHLSVVELAGERRWFTGFARDISETKRHEQQSELNRQKFTGIFESSIDALVCTTSDGTITDVNNTTVQLFGYKDKAELLGLNVSILTPPEHRKYHHLYIENYLKTGLKKVIGTTRELRGCRKDGSLFPIELSLSEVQTELVHGFIGSVRDLTARKEKERVDALLLNMLPSAIALRLSSLPLGGHIADSFDSATILFADIVGFTAMTEMLPPLVVVQYLNRIFSAFDEIAEELHVEKIKTIGDAYMAVTGIPEKTDNNAEVMLRFAIRMLGALEKFNSEAVARGEPQFGLRVGINSGTVVAGVIGSRKHLYDIWGSAANLASRMESTGVDRRIQVTDNVYQLTKHVPDFRFTRRGLVYCKGIGKVLTYYVETSSLPTAISPHELGDVHAQGHVQSHPQGRNGDGDGGRGGGGDSHGHGK